MSEFSIEHQYKLYLERIELSEESMHPEQKVQLRQAFYGAAGQMLLLLRDDISKLSDFTAVVVLEGMIAEVENYFDLNDTN